MAEKVVAIHGRVLQVEDTKQRVRGKVKEYTLARGVQVFVDGEEKALADLDNGYEVVVSGGTKDGFKKVEAKRPRGANPTGGLNLSKPRMVKDRRVQEGGEKDQQPSGIGGEDRPVRMPQGTVETEGEGERRTARGPTQFSQDEDYPDGDENAPSDEAQSSETSDTNDDLPAEPTTDDEEGSGRHGKTHSGHSSGKAAGGKTPATKKPTPKKR